MALVCRILLWLAETLGGVALKALVGRMLGRGAPPAPDLKVIAEASHAQAQVQQDEQIIAAEKDRAEVDEKIAAAGPGAAADDMQQYWNDPT
ncbi:hypothetical protein [Dyella sp.]|uniref:hypothetical protein n=1 Tax=Dyella sp. TaxID=1869338 RepID=UPI002D79FB92|nr:hypothetical protein [Dyella sp.]HET7332345.1 hypothetical protein [Dyella sp.]